uniref:Putative secreted protein n=1 Tax=Anopheles marajoara TaxID=58244 RepID=A0A2M4C8B1_9DIPT
MLLVVMMMMLLLLLHQRQRGHRRQLTAPGTQQEAHVLGGPKVGQTFRFHQPQITVATVLTQAVDRVLTPVARGTRMTAPARRTTRRLAHGRTQQLLFRIAGIVR